MNLLEDIAKLPRSKPRSEGCRERSCLQISADTVQKIRVTAATHNISMGYLVEYALNRFLSELSELKAA